jgi:RNA 2',3'-cyclic 3'-phosphodiesterase
MRIFIAVELPKEIKDSVEFLKESFKSVKGLRFVSRENVHVTMKFLGEVDENKVSELVAALNQVKFRPFSLSLSKLGVFPSEREMRVLWVSVEPEEPLLELKKQIDAVLPGFKDDHPFKSHITIARISYISPDDKCKVGELLMNTQIQKKEFLVEKFILYKSTLTPKGPVYENINRPGMRITSIFYRL